MAVCLLGTEVGEENKYMKRWILVTLLTFLSVTSIAKAEEWTKVSLYDNKIPSSVKINLKYKGEHPDIVDYVFVSSRTANIRDYPGMEGNIIEKYSYNDKLPLLEKIYVKGNYWYKVRTPKGNEGYIAASVSQKRNFRFDMALDKIKSLENFLMTEKAAGRKIAAVNSYAPNPNHLDLQKNKDKYGTSADQNTTGTNAAGETIYIPDRSLISIQSSGAGSSVVKALSIPETLTVSNRNISHANIPSTNFDKVIAIDSKNQNFIVFEKREGAWEVISYVYSKTGMDSKLGFETPKGFFSTAMGKYVMPYNDENGQKQGAAKYALRFCGGGYIHGTPINDVEEVNREFFMKQKEFTLGTYSGTRKCIRTSEPHAKFLFDWVIKKPNKSANAQNLTDNLVVIVF